MHAFLRTGSDKVEDDLPKSTLIVVEGPQGPVWVMNSQPRQIA